MFFRHVTMTSPLLAMLFAALPIFFSLFLSLCDADVMGSYDFIGVCIRNCAQCKKMFGSYFEGQMCADACVKFKGKIIPDCEDIGSIAPFLTKLD
ncbi:eclosion hormone [Phlebotomus argentipes]|uniref:eclosion hormone n=1 Tax=Phlebotomus argentipes TaxID=94469 RepID=UPI0028930F95|nr:eclosion hormone [Phlebotomus argentipes]